VPQDDVDHPGHRPLRRKPSRKLPNRRHYED
jgi:hypothetical protein